MRFAINKENLLYGLTYVNRVIPSKSDIPYLTNVLLKTQDDEIELFGTDIEEGIKTRVPAQIEEGGEVLINAKIFIDMIKKLPQGKPIEIKEEENNIIVSSGKSSYRIVKLSTEEFPKFPEIEGEEIEFFQKDILDMIKKVKFSAASDDQYPILRGVLFKMKDGLLEAFSTDGLRISYVRRESPIDKELSFVLPLKAVNHLERLLLPDEDVKFSVKINENQFFSQMEKVKMYTRLVRGEYPDLTEFINVDDFIFSILVPREELKDILNRVGVLLTPERNAVTFEISGNKMKVKTETPEVGFFEEEIDIINSDENIEGFKISFGQKFLVEFLDVQEKDEIEISFRESEDGEEKPVRVRGAGDNNHIYILMPYTLG